jgi:hypothetical protein
MLWHVFDSVIRWRLVCVKSLGVRLILVFLWMMLLLAHLTSLAKDDQVFQNQWQQGVVMY